MPRARGMASYVRDGFGAFRQHKFECGCCEMLVFRVCGVRQNLYVYSLYRNPDLDDRIFDCLLASMAAMQAEDVCAFFLFVCDLNGHHQVWYKDMNILGWFNPILYIKGESCERKETLLEEKGNKLV